MSDRYNISLEQWQGSMPKIKKLFYRTTFDDRYLIENLLLEYKGDYTVKDVAGYLLKDEELNLSEKWCPFMIADGLTEIRVDKKLKSIEMINWKPDYENKRTICEEE